MIVTGENTSDPAILIGINLRSKRCGVNIFTDLMVRDGNLVDILPGGYCHYSHFKYFEKVLKVYYGIVNIQRDTLSRYVVWRLVRRYLNSKSAIEAIKWMVENAEPNEWRLKEFKIDSDIMDFTGMAECLIPQEIIMFHLSTGSDRPNLPEIIDPAEAV